MVVSEKSEVRNDNAADIERSLRVVNTTALCFISSL